MYPVEKMCSLLKVSRSVFYNYCSKRESNRSKFDKVILEQIRQIHIDSRQTYGSPRISSVLHDKGYQISEAKVARMMKRNNISSITKKRYKVSTNSKHNYFISPNLLK